MILGIAEETLQYCSKQKSENSLSLFHPNGAENLEKNAKNPDLPMFLPIF
jgi:hypothetical protein